MVSYTDLGEYRLGMSPDHEHLKSRSAGRIVSRARRFRAVPAPFVRPLVAAALLLAAGQMPAPPAHAAASDWVTTDFSRLRLIVADDSAAAPEELDMGVQIRLEEGWKTYWRDPGDAGLPTSFDWSASRNVGDVTLAWPAPKRIPFEGLESYGYENEVVFPVRLRRARPGESVGIDLAVGYAVCRDICIPLEARVRLDIPAGASGGVPGTGAHRALIRRFAARVPARGGAAGMDIVAASVATEPDGKILRLGAEARPPFEDPDVFVEGPAGTFFGRPRVDLGDDPRTAVVELSMDDAGSGDGASRPLTVTLVDRGRAIERTIVPAR